MSADAIGAGAFAHHGGRPAIARSLFLRQRPRDKHICITGRDARAPLNEIADLVTEMTLVKHSYGAGYKAQRGVEF